MRITLLLDEHEKWERGFGYRMWVHLMAPDAVSLHIQLPRREMFFQVEHNLWGPDKAPSSSTCMSEHCQQLPYLVSMADQLPSDWYSLSETMLILSALVWMGTRLPRVSVVDQVLWRVDSETEICVRWECSWHEHLWWSEGSRIRKRELSCHAEWQGQPVPWEALELEWSLRVVLYQGKGPRLCSLHLSLDVGYH